MKNLSLINLCKLIALFFLLMPVAGLAQNWTEFGSPTLGEKLTQNQLIGFFRQTLNTDANEIPYLGQIYHNSSANTQTVMVQNCVGINSPWQSLGNLPTLSTNNPSPQQYQNAVSTLGYDGTPYVLFSTYEVYASPQYKVYLKKFVGGAWVDVETFSNVSEVRTLNLIVGIDNTIYYIYGVRTTIFGGYNYVVRKRQGNNVETISLGVYTNNLPKIAVGIDNTLYMGYLENNQIKAKKYVSNSWQNINGFIFEPSGSRGVIQIKTDIFGNVYMIHTLNAGQNNNSRLKVVKYQKTNNTWLDLGFLTPQEGFGGAIDIDANGTPYVICANRVWNYSNNPYTFQSADTRVFRYVNGTGNNAIWEQVGDLNADIGTSNANFNTTTFIPDISVTSKGNIFVTFNNQSLTTFVRKYTVCNNNIAITPNTLPNGIIGQSYNTTISATGLSTGTTEWSVIGLPSFLTWSSTFSGINIYNTSALVAGTYSFLVKVKQGACYVTKLYTITISNCVITQISLPTPPNLCAINYQGVLSATGFTSGATWSIGSITPAGSGLMLTQAGIIQGTPSLSGNITFNNVIITQNGTSSCPQNITINVGCPNITWSDNYLNWNCQSPNVSAQTGVNNCSNITWTATGLPSGWNINSSTGVITGTGTMQMSSVTIVVTANTTGCPAVSKTYYGYNTSGTTPPASGGFTICAMEYFPVQFDIPEGVTKLGLLSQSSYNVLMFGWCVDGCSGSGSISTDWAVYNVTGGTTVTLMAQIVYAGTFNFLIKTGNECGLSEETTMGQATALCEISGVCNTCNPIGGGGGNGGGNANRNNPSNKNIIQPLQITPNPVANELKLSGNAEMEYEVRLQDAQGKQIGSYTGKLAEIEGEMNKQVRNLKVGMYFVQFKPREGKAEVKKFVKVN